MACLALPRVASSCIVLVLLAGCMAPGATFDTITTAGWQEGDHFRSEISFAVDGVLRGYEDGALVAQEPIKAAEGPFDSTDLHVVAADLSFDGDAYYGVELAKPVLGWHTPFLAAMRQSDLTLRHLDAPVAADAPTDGFVYASDLDTYPWIRFPLVAGDSWDGIVDDPFGDGSLQIRSKVLGTAVVTTSLGSYDAVQVRHTMPPAGSTTIHALERELQAEEPSMSLEYDGTATTTLWWADALQAIVRTEGSSEEVLDASWTKQGTKYRLRLDMTTTFTEQIVHRDAHEPTGPLPDTDVDVPVRPPEPVDWELELHGVPEASNIGESFTVRATAGPDAVDVRVRVLGPDGSELLAGGARLEVTLPEVGWYVIEARAESDGRVVAWDALAVAGYMLGTEEMDCPLASALDHCSEATFPVTRFAGGLMAALGATGGGAPASDLVLMDADGGLWQAEVQGGEANVTVDDLKELPRDGREWTIRYDNGVELMAEAVAGWIVVPDETFPVVVPPPGMAGSTALMVRVAAAPALAPVPLALPPTVPLDAAAGAAPPPL